MLTAVLVPEGLDGVHDGLADEAELLAGGTYLMPTLNDRATGPKRLVSLRRAGLDGIAVSDTEVRLGAMVTLARIEDDPRLGVLHDCVRSIAARPVRSLATVAGNLFVPRPYGDLAVALLALDARVRVHARGGPSERSLADLLATGPAPGEVVTEVRFAPPAELRYHKASRRRFNSASLGTIAASLLVTDGVVREARIALGGLGRWVARCEPAERVLRGQPLGAEVVREAAAAALAVIEPFDDAYASAWYRRRVFPVHLRRALLGR